MKVFSKNKRGISLIILVITIIVMIIIAAAIILTLNGSGIINKAQFAKKSNDDASLEEAIAVAKSEAAMLEYTEQVAMHIEEIDDIFITLTETNYKNGIAKVVDGVPIPIGFEYVQGTKKDTGLIVVDMYGNEFVWVPVENVTTFTTLTDFGEGEAPGTEPHVASGATNDGNPINRDLIWEKEKYPTGLLEQFTTEYNNMVASVSIYGGFYVGRYQTRWTGTKVVCIKNTTPMTAATLLESNWKTNIEENGNKASWYGLYKKQKELYSDDFSVVSGMIYGCQYDAIMNWMKDIENSNAPGEKYIYNSTGMHNNKVKNIYHLAGNLQEWTQEGISIIDRVLRGIGYNTSCRTISNPRAVFDYYGSRLQLYIK